MRRCYRRYWHANDKDDIFSYFLGGPLKPRRNHVFLDYIGELYRISLTFWSLLIKFPSCCIVQISTSVQWTTEDVTFTQSATTLKEISLAPARHDMRETDSPVQVSQSSRRQRGVIIFPTQWFSAKPHKVTNGMLQLFLSHYHWLFGLKKKSDCIIISTSCFTETGPQMKLLSVGKPTQTCKVYEARFEFYLPHTSIY